MSFFIFDFSETGKKLLESPIIISYNFNFWRQNFSFNFNWRLEITFILDLNSNHDEDVIGESPSQRPRGIKKSKLKRKLDDQTSAVINSLEKGNKQLLEQLNQTNAQREHHFEIQKKNYALKELKEENKMLFLDLNSVQDPNIRAYIQAQQAQILQNRSLQQQAPPPSTSFGQYFNNFNGSRGDLPDY